MRCPECHEEREGIKESDTLFRCEICYTVIPIQVELQQQLQQQHQQQQQPRINIPMLNVQNNDPYGLVLQAFVGAAASATGGGGGGLFSKGASQKALDKIRRIYLKEGEDLSNYKADFMNVTIQVLGISLVGIPANFGPEFPHKALKAEFEYYGFLDQENDDYINSMKGKYALVTRGKNSFARKGLLAQKYGALGVIVIQSEYVFPYRMGDSLNEAKGLNIPMCIISKEGGDRVLELLANIQATEKKSMTIESSELDEKLCPICMDSLKEKTPLAIIPSPCCHSFHESCLLEWLKQKNTCPICRFELGAEN